MDPDCLFGVIYAMYLKYESSQRGGLHAHGQTCQPFLQAEQLRRMMADGTVFQEHLFAFFESLMCAYFPVPQCPPSPSSSSPRPWVEASPLCSTGMVCDQSCIICPLDICTCIYACMSHISSCISCIFVTFAPCMWLVW